MNLSDVAIRRPVFTVMVTVGLLVLGVLGYRNLGTDLFPDVSFPVVVVNVPYPGANPAEVETLVTRPIEDAVVGINGIDRLRSYSREGLSTIIVIFKLDVSISEGANEVRERLSQVRYRLPRDVLEPTIGRLDVAAAPVLTYVIGGDRPLAELREIGEDVIKPSLEQVPGVASVEVTGGAKREVSVRLDRGALDGLNLDAMAVVQRLRAANLTVPAGRFEEGAREVSVRTVGALASVDQVRDVVVASGWDGSAVRLRDVAEVEDGFEEARTRVRVNGEEAVSFAVLKQSGENTVAIAELVKARLERLGASLPEGVEVHPIVDQSRFIKGNAEEVEIAIVYGGAMAILIIFVFMLDLRSTLISAVALPTSVIGTFFAMDAFGFSLNMLTLLGLSLAIGLLIDDAVVVRENIFKHLERGKDPFSAARDGTREIALSVLATTLTIVAVFMPVAFVKGIVGQFFRQFGITVSVAVVLSLFVAFTLDPMLSARFSATVDHQDAAWKAPFLRFFAAMDDTYRAILHWALARKLVVGAASLASIVLMGFVAGLMGNEFVNAEDRGQFVLDLEFDAGTSLAETSRLSAAAEERLRAHPQVVTVLSTLGPSGEANRARWRVVTTPKNERKETLADLKDAARAAAEVATGAKVSVTDPPFIEGAQTEAPIMVNVRGPGYGEVVPAAEEVARILRETPGVQDVVLRYSPGLPELQVKIDPLRAADRRVPVAQVALAVRTAMEGDEAGKVRDGNDEIPIKVRLREADRADPATLAGLTVMGPKGPVKLGDVAELIPGEGPQVIEREGRSRQIQIWAAPRGRPLGEIAREIKPRVAALDLAPGVVIDYDGQIRLMDETNTNMLVALLLGVVFIYLVLASQFESFIHPITIMLTLPLALVGAVLALFLTGNTMAMGAMIGIVLLMGLVTKNAILLVDRAIVRVREHGEPPLRAILEAGPERLRPILMTSAAMALGMLPTALGRGEGSEFRAPMAIAIIGGVVSSTLLSLVVVPAFYLAIEDLKARFVGRRGARAPVEPLASRPS